MVRAAGSQGTREGNMSEPKKILLTEEEMPRQWYNMQADLPHAAAAAVGPDGKPISPEMLAPVFPMNLIEQECQHAALDRHSRGGAGGICCTSVASRAAVRARNLEKALNTPAKIYYKNEGVSPAGSHKPNTAVRRRTTTRFGIKRLTTETGAGQWGSALAMACKLMFGLECKVFMVRISFDQKPFRKIMMQTWGAECVASPSTETNAGRRSWPRSRTRPGSLGIAISEAIEAAVTIQGQDRYSLGSVLNHVLLHQTIIGLEAKKQFEKIGEISGRGHRLRGRRLELRRAGLPVRVRQDSRQECAHHGRGAGGLPDADARAVRLRLRRRGDDDAAAGDAQPGAHRSCRSRSTPAACATTAWRRWSATCCART
jgi:hypothetical protein